MSGSKPKTRRRDPAAAALTLGLELKAMAKARAQDFRKVREAATVFAGLERYDTRRAFDALVAWTRARLAASGHQRVVFGASGGVDSSLTACVLEAACPGGVTALVLPCHSDPADERDARALCRALHLPIVRKDLGPAFDVLRDTLSPSVRGTSAEGNLKTRLRTMTLFHEASVRGALCVGTGDLDEGVIGYYTKGSASDLAPLGSLHKSEVRALLAVSLGRVNRTLAARLSKKPAAPGLTPGVLAEDELGLSYDVIERCLDLMLETCSVHDAGVVPIEVDEFARAFALSGLTRRDFLQVAALVRAARHKATRAPTPWRRAPGRPGRGELDAD